MDSLQSPSLPFDVLTEIISVSDLDTDVETLKALSMTCRATVEPSQRRLFNTIEILVIPHSSDETRPIYSTLKDIFNSSPHLATYVCHLTIKFEIPCPDTSCVVPALEKLCSIQSLRINYSTWIENPEDSLQWREVLRAILHHPSLRRLDLEDCGLLPSIVLQLPVLLSIDLAEWRIEEPDSTINYARSVLTRRLAMSWDGTPNSPSTLRSFLKITPHLAHLKVTQYSNPDADSHFMGLSREIVNSPQTLLNLETLTLFFIFHSFIPPLRIAEELRELSLSNENALQRIRFDLKCDSGLTNGAGILGYLMSLNLNLVQWSGFSRLLLVEVEVDIFVGGAGVPTDSPAFNGDLERAMREVFRRAMNRADVEVTVTLYLNGIRPGGDTFRPALSWERFAILSSN